MPVPKRKVSKARRDQRSANKNIDPQPFVYCPNTACKGEPLLPHMACPRCGFYKNRKVMTGEIDKEVKNASQTASTASTPEQHDAQVNDTQ